MKALRNSIERNYAAVRVAVLVLACYTLLPTQLVWCHEDGPGPRLEASFHGTCIPGANSECCSPQQAPVDDGCCSTKVSPAMSQCCAHEHCVGCSDQLVHTKQSVSPVRTLSVNDRNLDGGCLFVMATATGLPDAALTGTPGWDRGELIPPLIEVTTLTVLLLI